MGTVGLEPSVFHSSPIPPAEPLYPPCDKMRRRHVIWRTFNNTIYFAVKTSQSCFVCVSPSSKAAWLTCIFSFINLLMKPIPALLLISCTDGRFSFIHKGDTNFDLAFACRIEMEGECMWGWRKRGTFSYWPDKQFPGLPSLCTHAISK
ncbi:hypothetical protein EYF80_017854 [Liparis tanakae]|uniref:Uncharacterized protein n=1 Tax=Liparis tanakae TaxID=230148 RepID=A0A4Z2I1I9_9TELE|nr:hypothetical protein EYF80_017854 [Liparis tanakae]